MSNLPCLVTPYTFKEKQYIIKMSLVRKNSLELSIIDKYSAEEWRCSYDSSYIENLTHKTGNFKQFDIFVTMLKSGILQTSECITLDLLTLEDLESLKKKSVSGCDNRTQYTSQSKQTLTSRRNSANRRYLILSYHVEFDRVYYPLPLEHVAPPNTQVLLGTIRRLEAEVEKLKSILINEGERNYIAMWRDRIRELEADNYILTEEVAYLRWLLFKNTEYGSRPSSGNIPTEFKHLKEQIRRERTLFKATLKVLQDQNKQLKQEIDDDCPEDLHTTDASYGKFDDGRDKRQRPAALNVSSLRLDGISGLPSPEILVENIFNKNKKGREILHGDECRRNSSKTIPEHRCKVQKKNNSKGREHSSSGSSYHSRLSNYCDLGTEPHCTNKSKSKTSVSERMSSSHYSDISNKGKEKDISQRKKSSSRSSSFSDTSLSSGSRFSIRSAKQNASVVKPSTVLPTGNKQASTAKNTRTKCKSSLRKNSLLNKDSRTGISELEARIKALQKFLREGFSIP